jgi:hypothetical protein
MLRRCKYYDCVDAVMVRDAVIIRDGLDGWGSCVVGNAVVGGNAVMVEML